MYTRNNRIVSVGTAVYIYFFIFIIRYRTSPRMKFTAIRMKRDIMFVSINYLRRNESNGLMWNPVVGEKDRGSNLNILHIPLIIINRWFYVLKQCQKENETVIFL